MKPLLPPLHIAIAASLALMAGTVSLVRLIAGFVSGHPTFDVGMFAILFGWGLLCRKGAVRNWVIFFSGLFFVGSAGHTVHILWKQVFGKDPWVPLDSSHDLISLLLIALVSLYTLIVLCLPRHKEWFKPVRLPDEQRAAEREGARFIVLPVLAVSLVLAAFIRLGEWWSDGMLRGAYPLDVQVVGYDEETGERLNTLSGLQSQLIFSRDERAKLPKYSIGSIAQPQGDHAISVLTIEGVFNRPFEFTLTTSGDYEPAIVKLDRNSPAEIRVPLKRKK